MRKLVMVTCTVLIAYAAHAANVTIPAFQLLTRGAMDDGTFVLRTQADIDVELGGGYKFGGQLGLSLNTVDLEAPSTPGDTYEPDVIRAALDRSLTLSYARVVVRDLFGVGVDLDYFVGRYRTLLSGDIFPEQFGSAVVASDMRGLLYFPDGVVYNGIHTINGTGLGFALPGLAPWLYLDAALYQDGYLGQGRYSTDLRAAFNFMGFKAETFAGATFPEGAIGAYRAGLLLYYATGTGGEFLTQIGVPRWRPVADGPLTIDDFMFLFEPRVDLGLLSVILTLFWHPQYYHQAPTGERGATDIIVKLLARDREADSASGGLETALRLRPDDPDRTLRVVVSPFLTLHSLGVDWDFKVNLNVFPFAPDDLVEGFVGFRTQF
ncbi:MAG: hypothetical protein EA382_09425 [Spirochaetaceae bacterium]|nr:MAG: hypothetical protein EA382_09425 [Spirochaetaceae bacterium]